MFRATQEEESFELELFELRDLRGDEEEAVADEGEGCVDAGGGGEDFAEAGDARVGRGGKEGVGGERELCCFVCGHCDIKMLGSGGLKVLLKEDGEDKLVEKLSSDVRCALRAAGLLFALLTYQCIYETGSQVICQK